MKPYQNVNINNNLTSEESTLFYRQICSQLAREPEYHYIHFHESKIYFVCLYLLLLSSRQQNTLSLLLLISKLIFGYQSGWVFCLYQWFSRYLLFRRANGVVLCCCKKEPKPDLIVWFDRALRPRVPNIIHFATLYSKGDASVDIS